MQLCLRFQLQKKERDMTDIRNASYIRNADIILPLEHGPCKQEDQARNSHSHRPITGQECSQRGIQWICKFTGVNRVAHLKAAPATHPNHNVAYRACACAEEGCQRSMQVCGISKEHCHPPTPSSTWHIGGGSGAKESCQRSMQCRRNFTGRPTHQEGTANGKRAEGQKDLWRRWDNYTFSFQSLGIGINIIRVYIYIWHIYIYVYIYIYRYRDI